MNNKTAFPLCWPAGWPQTEPHLRETAKFKTDLPAALANLTRQIELMGGKNVLLSSNYTLGVTRPKEPGIVAFFVWNKLDMAIPCDRWNRIEANVQAVALTVEAMRGMDRWGAKHMIRAMFTGFKLLPLNTDAPAWWETLGVASNASPEQVRQAYLILSKKHHPDMGGDPELFRRANEAWQQFKQLVPT